jgi:hypothetical protein
MKTLELHSYGYLSTPKIINWEGRDYKVSMEEHKKIETGRIFGGLTSESTYSREAEKEYGFNDDEADNIILLQPLDQEVYSLPVILGKVFTKKSIHLFRSVDNSLIIKGSFSILKLTIEFSDGSKAGIKGSIYIP